MPGRALSAVCLLPGHGGRTAAGAQVPVRRCGPFLQRGAARAPLPLPVPLQRLGHVPTGARTRTSDAARGAVPVERAWPREGGVAEAAGAVLGGGGAGSAGKGRRGDGGGARPGRPPAVAAAAAAAVSGGGGGGDARRSRRRWRTGPTRCCWRW